MKDPTGDNQSTQIRTDGVTPMDGLSELLAMAADHAQVGVVITDEAWDIVHASHGFLTMAGVESDDSDGVVMVAARHEFVAMES